MFIIVLGRLFVVPLSHIVDLVIVVVIVVFHFAIIILAAKDIKYLLRVEFIIGSVY